MKLLGFFVVALLAASCCYALQENVAQVSHQCLKCLCEGSTNNCDKNAGCDNYGYCGPFRLSKHYWEEAGGFENDFETCAKKYECAEKTVKAYMEKYGKDCDGDGKTDCKDFALIHHKGRHGCPYTDYSSDSLYKFVADCISRNPEELHDRKAPQSTDEHMLHEQLKDRSQDLKQQTQNVGESVKDKAHETKEGLKDRTEGVKSQMGNVGENIRDQARGAGESIRDQARGAKDQAQNIGQDLKQRTQQFGENVKGKVQGAKDNIKDKFEGAKSSVQEGARDLKDKIMPQQHERQDFHNVPSSQQSDLSSNIQQQQSEHKGDIHREQGQLPNIQGSDREHQQQHEKLDEKHEPMPLPEMIRHRRHVTNF